MKGSASKVSEEEKLKKKNDPKHIEEKELEELEKEEYEIFDDYLEMIITFGYITLFACKYSIIFNLLL